MSKKNGRPRKNKDRVLYDSDLTKEEDATLRRMIVEYGTTGRKLVTKLFRQWIQEQQIKTL